MPKGGLRATSFKPGKSGNPTGRPRRSETIEARRIVADVKLAARELMPDALSTLQTVMNDREPPPPEGGGFGLRLKAGFGRPQGPTRGLARRL